MVRLTITDGHFKKQRISYARNSYFPNAQPFEGRANLFLWYLRNNNTLSHGIINTLKDRADAAFESFISENAKLDAIDIFMMSLEKGYDTNTNTIQSVTISSIINLVTELNGFTNDVLNFTEAGVNIAEFPVILVNYGNMKHTFESFKII
ncbi:MAG: hypothetical protein ACLKAK_04560 [Alkaliphilus sp.]